MLFIAIVLLSILGFAYHEQNKSESKTKQLFLQAGYTNIEIKYPNMHEINEFGAPIIVSATVGHTQKTFTLIENKIVAIK